MMPFLKIPVESARRMWQAGRHDGLINLVAGLEWKMERQWLRLVSDHKRKRKPKA